MQVLLALVCVLGLWGVNAESPCLLNSFAPITTRLLADELSSSFQFPGTAEGHIETIYKAQILGTEQQAALFFATPAANKLFVRTRNCAAPEFAGVVGDACEGRTDRIYEVYSPVIFSDELNHVYTYDSQTVTEQGTFTFAEPTVYTPDAQFWYAWGINGGSGFLNRASGIPELNANSTAAAVYVRAARRGGAVIAAVGGIRSASEPCTPSLDCVLGAWTDFGRCSVDCGGGYQTRTRPVIANAQNGGLCGALGDQKQCNTQQCATELSDEARAGVVIACLASVILAGLIFFSLAKQKKVFTTKSKAQRKAAAAAAAAAKKEQQLQQQHQQHDEAQQQHHKHASHEATGEDDDETVAVAQQPVKTVHIWV